jgi:hypothetical protein
MFQTASSMQRSLSTKTLELDKILIHVRVYDTKILVLFFSFFFFGKKFISSLNLSSSCDFFS